MELVLVKPQNFGRWFLSKSGQHCSLYRIPLAGKCWWSNLWHHKKLKIVRQAQADRNSAAISGDSMHKTCIDKSGKGLTSCEGILFTGIPPNKTGNSFEQVFPPNTGLVFCCHVQAIPSFIFVSRPREGRFLALHEEKKQSFEVLFYSRYPDEAFIAINGH